MNKESEDDDKLAEAHVTVCPDLEQHVGVVLQQDTVMGWRRFKNAKRPLLGDFWHASVCK